MRLSIIKAISFLVFLIPCNILISQVFPVTVPADNQTVYYQNVEFTFPSKIQNSRLQITNDKTFNSIIIDTVINQNVVIIPTLEKNVDHYWRLQDIKKTCSETRIFRTSGVKIESSPIDDFPIKLVTSHQSEHQSIIIDNPDQKMLDVEVYDNFGRLLIRQRTDASLKGLNLLALSNGSEFEVNILSDGRVFKSKVSF